MAFKEIAGNRKYRGWKEWETGDFIVGNYEAIYTDSYGKNGYAIRIEETNINEFGDDNLNQGDLIGLNSCGSLDFKMETVNVGSKIKVVYSGKETMTKGKFKGKDFHKVEVFVDDEYASKVKVKEVEQEEIGEFGNEDIL